MRPLRVLVGLAAAQLVEFRMLIVALVWLQSLASPVGCQNSGARPEKSAIWRQDAIFGTPQVIIADVSDVHTRSHPLLTLVTHPLSSRSHPLASPQAERDAHTAHRGERACRDHSR
jgi:hypothetical protein